MKKIIMYSHLNHIIILGFLGDNPYSGTLTPFIHGTFSDQVDSCILDGEMMGYDPGLKLFMQKGGK